LSEWATLAIPYQVIYAAVVEAGVETLQLVTTRVYGCVITTVAKSVRSQRYILRTYLKCFLKETRRNSLWGSGTY
jgi:carbon starvation protein CstA